MNIDKVLERLHERGLLEKLEDKRLTTPKLPATLYLKLLIASLATGKTRGGLGQTILTALHTYANRNAENHASEFLVEALKREMEVEDVIAEAIAQSLNSLDDDNA